MLWVLKITKNLWKTKKCWSRITSVYTREVIKKEMKEADKGVVVFAIIFMVGITFTAWAYTILFSNQVAAPSGRRWPVTTAMD
jgi:hypothetical protein